MVVQPLILAAIKPLKPTAPVPKITMDEAVFGFKPLTTVPYPVKKPQLKGATQRKSTSLSTLIRLLTFVIVYVEKEL